MTTTAEKIKVMQAFEDGKKIEFIRPRRKGDTRPATRGWILWSETWEEPLWDWDLCDYRIKPPDPEPLECWVNKWNHAYGAYESEELARTCARASTPLREAVPVREVTPQDEQDRKDAARFRLSIELDWINEKLEKTLDRMLANKAMEEQ